MRDNTILAIFRGTQRHTVHQPYSVTLTVNSICEQNNRKIKRTCREFIIVIKIIFYYHIFHFGECRALKVPIRRPTRQTVSK